MLGIDPRSLTNEDLVRELDSLYRTRLDTLWYGLDDALEQSTARTIGLEQEDLRGPEREVDPERLCEGARQR